MTQEATQLEVPNFEATTDGKKSSHRSNGLSDSGNTQNGHTKWTLRN